MFAESKQIANQKSAIKIISKQEFAAGDDRKDKILEKI